MFFVTVVVFLLTATDIVRCSTDSPEIPDNVTIHKVIGDWEEADLQCRSEGAVLASPVNADLLNVMKSLIGVNNTPYFIGTRSRDGSRSFISVEGVTLEKMGAAVLAMIQKLDPEEGSCLSMDRHSISVVPCWSRLPFICCKAQLEQSNVTTERTQLDRRLSTGREETDDVTTERLDRVGHNASCDGEGYTYEKSTGSCYKIHTDLRTWDDAAAICVAERAHLVVIDDAAEAQVIRKMAKQTYPFTFIGVRDYSENNVWESVNGKRLEDIYHVWHSGEPIGFGVYCVMIRPTGNIDNYSCREISNFICERSP